MPPYYSDDEDPDFPIYRDANTRGAKQQRPKWMIPTIPLEIAILDACGRTYYDRTERNFVREVKNIVRGTIPWNPQMQDMAYPLEWVESCIGWAKKKRSQEGIPIKLLGLVNLIKNKDRKAMWLSQNRDKLLARPNIIPGAEMGAGGVREKVKDNDEDI
jgi:hypothetical protein